MKSNKKIFTFSYLSSLFSFVSVFATQVHAQAAAWAGKCVGTGTATDVATLQGLECLVGNVLSVIISIIGIAAFVMFLVGSFSYLTAGSNSKGVEKGKNSISFAILGIVVALASFLMLRFVSQFTGVTSILQFNTQVTP